MDLFLAYQAKLIEIGRVLGYESRRSFKKSAMGDAVWLDRRGLRFSEESLPVAAFKLLTFETETEIRGAISTIQAISPSLGVLVVLEDAYAEKSLVLKRFDERTYPIHIRETAQRLAEAASLMSRNVVWGQRDVDALYVREVDGRLPF